MKAVPLRTEFNVARLGLISIQQRLPQSSASWEAGTLIDGQAGAIRCVAGAGMQVPHGMDGDVLSAIMTLYYAQDHPSDRLVRTNIRELMRVAQVKQLDGKHYQIFKESLARLNRGAYSLKSAWKRKGVAGRLDANFYILESVTGWQRDEPLIPGREEEDLVIGLSPHLAYSAASGYVLSTQPAVMRTLGSAAARGQYRLFEALRADTEDPSHLNERLHLSAQEFSGYARLLGGAQDAFRVRRIVEPALKQLHASGYLQRYEVIGRGAGLSFLLEFSGHGTVTDQRSVTRLGALGVTANIAQQLALGHSRQEIEAVCWLAEQKAERARKNPRLKEVTSLPGLIVTMLRAGDGPSAIRQFEDRQKKTQTAARRKPTPAPEVESPAPPDARTLRFLLKGTALPDDLMARLEHLFLQGRVTSVQITQLKKCSPEAAAAQISTWEET
ncbi:hypothetical protein Dalu01_02326 [Deinococcus aluminii]|uniref:Plasmid replication initiator protein n=2 Tax=Deinococcus aluminii TaxID=1656885 RepID=A0ABP9XH18_9DEIO